MPGQMPVWECAPPNATAGCPAIEPNSGDPCTLGSDQQCFYGPGCFASETQCVNGFWQWELLACG